MKHLKLIVVTMICGLSTFACRPAEAGTLSRKQQLSSDLLLAMDMPQNMESAFQRMKRTQQLKFEGMDLQEEQKDLVLKYQQLVFDVLGAHMSWKAIEPRYISIYTDTFSEKELAAILDFYRSDAGKVFVKAYPEIMKSMAQVNQQVMLEMMPELETLNSEFRETLRQQLETAVPAMAK
ncbi:MAG: DUF2059 domain-containing protein [Spartobacteria bacterium]|nr:DUF2059 domain-containing protein [Spartobacteria bacterium]